MHALYAAAQRAQMVISTQQAVSLGGYIEEPGDLCRLCKQLHAADPPADSQVEQCVCEGHIGPYRLLLVKAMHVVVDGWRRVDPCALWAKGQDATWHGLRDVGHLVAIVAVVANGVGLT